MTENEKTATMPKDGVEGRPFEGMREADAPLENPPSTSVLPDQPSDAETAKQYIKRAQEKAEFMKELMMSMIALTSRTDWVAFKKVDPSTREPIGNEWRLTHSGAERVMAFLGIQLRGPGGSEMPTVRKEKTEDDGYMYIYEGVMQMTWFGGTIRTYPCFGVCTTTKAFHRGSVGGASEKSIEQIDEGNIMKDAHSNMLSRGVRGLIGFGSQGDDAMDEFFKKKGWSMGSVGFAQGGQGGNSTPTDAREHQQAIAGMLRDLAGEDEKAQADFLQDFTSFQGKDGPVPGLRSIKALKDRRLEVTYGKLKKLHEDTFGKDATVGEVGKGKGDKS